MPTEPRVSKPVYVVSSINTSISFLANFCMKFILDCVQLKKNVLSVDFHISQYPKIIEKLKEEVSGAFLADWTSQIWEDGNYTYTWLLLYFFFQVLELRGKLQDYEDGKIQIQIPKTLENLPPDTLVDTCKWDNDLSPVEELIRLDALQFFVLVSPPRFRETFVNIFRERFALRRDLNNLEVMKRDLKQKISFEQIECTRLSLILSDSEELAKVRQNDAPIYNAFSTDLGAA